MDRNPMAEDKRKGRKPTRIEYDQRIELTYQLLAKGQRPSVIARAVEQKFGGATKTVKDQYLSRARTIMLAEIARAKTELRAESLALYRAIIAEPKASNRDKIKGQEGTAKPWYLAVRWVVERRRRCCDGCSKECDTRIFQACSYVGHSPNWRVRRRRQSSVPGGFSRRLGAGSMRRNAGGCSTTER